MMSSWFAHNFIIIANTQKSHESFVNVVFVSAAIRSMTFINFIPRL